MHSRCTVGIGLLLLDDSRRHHTQQMVGEEYNYDNHTVKGGTAFPTIPEKLTGLNAAV
jgi:hypothetical protein